MKYYIDIDGNYIGSYDGLECDQVGAIEVSSPPLDARQKWDGEKYLDYTQSIQEQIDDLESSITKRNERGLRIGDQWAINKVNEIDAAIELLRAEL